MAALSARAGGRPRPVAQLFAGAVMLAACGGAPSRATAPGQAGREPAAGRVQRSANERTTTTRRPRAATAAAETAPAAAAREYRLLVAPIATGWHLTLVAASAVVGELDVAGSPSAEQLARLGPARMDGARLVLAVDRSVPYALVVTLMDAFLARGVEGFSFAVQQE